MSATSNAPERCLAIQQGTFHRFCAKLYRKPILPS
ncbi:hypothetical protein Y043_2835 [Burkholderia pseudomallei MSHR2138]|nr:hypothetical protein Y043_2835 [Burkholderia pseudomallei MSHR2138]